MPLRVPAVTALLALAAAALVLFGCASDLSDAIAGARQLAGEVTSDAGPAEHIPAQRPAVGASDESPEIQSVLATLGGLKVAARGSEIDYNRDDWRHWIDADRDCQNTRAEVLIDESVATVSFAPDDDGDKCRVISGRWVGPWTGRVFTDASDVDIDHHVPLGHAHESGGWRWDPERKRAYANDLAHPESLQATSAPVNRAKGKQPPDEWRPDEAAGWCDYAADWITVKQKWDLTVTSSEVVALEDMLATCSDTSSWGLSGARGR